jgi:hypothetical protein
VHLRGCAASTSADDLENDDLAVELPSSATSASAGSLRVSPESSVFVGLVGDCEPPTSFSLTMVSPVIARAGAIGIGGAAAGARRKHNG